MAGARASIQGPKIARIMIGLERAIMDSRRETILKASMAAKVIHSIEIDKATGGDSRLSGMNNARVGARFDVKGGFDPESHIKATGPIQIIEGDTAGHVIRSKHVTGRARRGFIGPGASFRKKEVTGPSLSPVLNIPGIGYRRSARHPGTTGRHPWAIGKKKAQPAITKIMRTNTFNIIKKAAKA